MDTYEDAALGHLGFLLDPDEISRLEDGGVSVREFEDRCRAVADMKRERDREDYLALESAIKELGFYRAYLKLHPLSRWERVRMWVRHWLS